MNPTRIAASAALVAAAVTAASADTIVLDAAKDNTLYENEDGFLSNGAGDRIFCGRSFQGTGLDIKRPVIAFDVASAVPAGSTITAVTLTLTVEQTGSTFQTCTLHRLQQDWGEAGSVAAGGGGGGGTFPDVGDATWIHTFYDETTPSFWDNAGGDFDAADSASALAGAADDSVSWSSTTMVAEVQGWLDAPATNFGWLILGNESSPGTAKAFASRENETVENRPALEITFDPPASPCPGNTNGDGAVDVNDLNNVILDWGTDGSAHGGDITGPVPDSPPDGIVDVNDLNAVIVHWGPCPPPK